MTTGAHLGTEAPRCTVGLFESVTDIPDNQLPSALHVALSGVLANRSFDVRREVADQIAEMLSGVLGDGYEVRIIPPMPDPVDTRE